MWPLVVLASALFFVVVLVHKRVERVRAARLRESARREGATLIARALRHRLGNTLAVTVGYSELLADDPRLPADLGEQAERIKASALAAVDTVEKLRGSVVRVELDARVSGPPMLDLNASIDANESADTHESG